MLFARCLGHGKEVIALRALMRLAYNKSLLAGCSLKKVPVISVAAFILSYFVVMATFSECNVRLYYYVFLSAPRLPQCVCVCVCGGERERERERTSLCLHVRARSCV